MTGETVSLFVVVAMGRSLLCFVIIKIRNFLINVLFLRGPN